MIVPPPASVAPPSGLVLMTGTGTPFLALPSVSDRRGLTRSSGLLCAGWCPSLPWDKCDGWSCKVEVERRLVPPPAKEEKREAKPNPVKHTAIDRTRQHSRWQTHHSCCPQSCTGWTSAGPCFHRSRMSPEPPASTGPGPHQHLPCLVKGRAL